MRRMISGLVLLASAFVGLTASSANAQILIWSLPKEDGAWVRFEGTYRQTQSRPESNAGDEALEWRTELMISSVGRAQAAFEGSEVPCRWVEFKSLTKANDLNKQPGPGGTIWYKVLIPEHKVIGKPVDEDGIPVMFLPTIKGYRKVGTGDPQAVSDRALAVYPTIMAPAMYYPDLNADESAEKELKLPYTNSPVAVRGLKGTRVIQNVTSRSTNAAVLWLSDAVPFGLAKFQVSITREEKGLTASVDAFRRKSLIEVEQQAVAVGADAKTELPNSN